MFGVENDQISFITVQFELVQSHPVLNVNHAGFDSPNSDVLVDIIAMGECRVELTVISIKNEMISYAFVECHPRETCTEGRE